MTSSSDNHAKDHHENIHLPAPTYWPLVFGFGFMGIAFGIILNIWLLAGAGLAVVMVAVGGWLWSNIRERIHPSETPAEAAKFAMWCFLGTEVVIFGALIGRVMGIRIADPGASHILVEPLSSLLLVSVNTFILLVSSLGVVLALASIQQGNRRGLVTWLAVTAVLGAAFLGIQAYEYTKLVHEGLTITSSQFGSAFYILTGNHGLHVLIGVIWCLVILFRAVRGGFTQGEHLGIEIFGLYWHFVDVVWIVIFTLVYLI
jgi:heme/copper-type cytochrome/quinol oxidase subunit 3